MPLLFVIEWRYSNVIEVSEIKYSSLNSSHTSQSLFDFCLISQETAMPSYNNSERYLVRAFTQEAT
jgi:hypothetical protein